MEQHFFDLLVGDTVIDSSAQVQTQLVTTIQRDEHSNGDEAARVARQTGAGPDFSPGISRDEILKLFVERRYPAPLPFGQHASEVVPISTSRVTGKSGRLP